MLRVAVHGVRVRRLGSLRGHPLAGPATPGSVGILSRAWANTLSRSYGVASDNSGQSLLSPFCENHSYPRFVPAPHPSVVCPIFVNGTSSPTSHDQPLRLLSDLILTIERQPTVGQLVFYPAGRNLPSEWGLVFPALDSFRFQKMGHGLRASRVFCSDGGQPSAAFSLWWVGSPEAKAPLPLDTINNLCDMTRRCGAVVTAPPSDFSTSPAQESSFKELWNQEVKNRRDMLAPRWCPKRRVVVSQIKWTSVFDSWDRVNAHLHTAPQRHIHKLHALRRPRASTRDKGTRIYALWTADNKKIYIGQTGARLNQRSVGTRGSEHIRLGNDYLRVHGEKLRVPSLVYKWVSKIGPKRVVATPLECVSSHHADRAERDWMVR